MPIGDSSSLRDHFSGNPARVPYLTFPLTEQQQT